MFGLRQTGSLLCRSCGKLVGLKDERCYDCGARYPALWGYSTALRRMGFKLGFTQIAVGATTALYLLTLLADVQGIRSAGMLDFLQPSLESLLRFGASGSLPIFGLPPFWEGNRWWTVLSAGWLHGSAVHILFNVLWIRQLGPVVEDLYGSGRTVILYTVASVTGFLFSSYAGTLYFLPSFLQGGRITLGASAGVFGLLGAMIYYSRRSGDSRIGNQVWGWAVFLFVLGFVWSGVDNWAHLGGFVGGWLASRWLDPLRRESPSHLMLAVVLLALTALSLVLSLLVPIPPELLALLRR